MAHRRYPNITPQEEARIRRDAAYGGLKDGGEAVLRQMQREREQGGTDKQVLQAARRQNPVAVDKAIQQEVRNQQYGGHKDATGRAMKIVVDRLVGRQ